jgi:hypothetical protein
MKLFKNVCAQGDVYIRKINELPERVTRILPEHGKLIVTHSETGHHHVMDAEVAEMYSLPDNIMDCLLVIHEPAVLEHLRSFDQHEPIQFEPGIYHVRRQREYTPKGVRQVEE